MLRRFTVEEVANGWVVTTREPATDKLLDRHVFLSVPSMVDFLGSRLAEQEASRIEAQKK